MARMPQAEQVIEEALVRALLDEQHPDLADLEVRHLAHGWDNESFRLGADLVVRLPRREAAAELVVHEQRWLPVLGPGLPLPVPVPVRVGVAGCGYPWSWSVVPWFPGLPWASAPPDDPYRAAEDLGRFLRRLHHAAPADAPVNPYRGMALVERRPRLEECLGAIGDAVDAGAVRSVFTRCEGSTWRHGPVWLHGDLHPFNVLTDDGEVSAVVDFGDLCSGDPATDLAIGWMALPPGPREHFRAAAGLVDDDTWERARGWALALGLAYLAASDDNPAMAQIGRRAVWRALDPRSDDPSDGEVSSWT